MKKALTILLALALLLAMNVPALAEGGGSITIDNAINGKQYTIYRIFDLNSHSTDYSAVNYKVSEKWKDFFTTGAEGLNYVDIDSQGYVTWKTSASAANFAAAAIAYAETNHIDHDGQTTAASGKAEFTNLTLGYYLVKTNLGALCSLNTTQPSVTIKEKNSAPVPDKQVQEDSNSEWGKLNDADVGQTVSYKTTISVTDGLPKGYVLHDAMSEGLTFNESSVKVTVGSTTLVNGTDYTVVTSNLNDGCTFEVRFTDGVLKPNDVAVVSYTATINDKAVIGGAGNKNTTHLDYINNGEVTHSPASETTTYVWKMSVLKYAVKDNKEIPLAGAQFKLYKMENNTAKYAVVDANNRLTGWTDTESNASVFTTPAEGKFTVSGLDADTYYLKEIVAPAGYNLLANPIEVTISTTTSNSALTSSVTYKEDNTSVTANPDVKVLNQTGALLPETGGMGTTVFYLVGSLLVLVAVVLLVTRKKMSAGK